MTIDEPAVPTIADAISQSVDVLPSRELAPGEYLLTRGDTGEEAYWVERGCLQVLGTDGAVVTELGTGALVGEYSALTGGERTATIRASESSVVRVVGANHLESLIASDARLAGSVRDEAARRVHATRVREVLGEVVGPGHPEVVAALADCGTWRHLAPGETLFSAGDEATCGFVIVSGRLRRLQDGATGFGSLAAGSVVGEEGFAGGRRVMTIEAVRDTVVFEISGADFAALVVQNPAALTPVVLGLAGGVAPPRRTLDRTVAVAVTADLNARQTCARLADALAEIGTVQHLWSARVDGRLDRPGIAQAQRGDPAEVRLLEHLARLEHDSRYLLLEPDRDHTPWTSRVLRQADVLAVIASEQPDTDEQARIDELIEHAGPRTSRVLVLVHPDDAQRPHGTAAVLSRWAVDHALHVRAGSVSDLGRVARTIVGRPTALVLGGGGAKGFASLGVYRAMTRLGIPVDAVGATSIGAPLGAGFAQALPPDEIQAESARLFHGILDYTIPLVSLLKGEKTAASIRERFEGWTIEDLWLPYFCVSTNLTQGRAEIHRRGDVTTALRASVAIPGAFPPVPMGDDLLVDGGVTNNLPVDVMRRLYPAATIIAVEVAPAKGPRAKSDFGLSVSGWQALKSKAGRGPHYPGLIAVLMRSMITGSLDHRDAVISQGMADLLLDLDMRGVGLLDFDSVNEVADRGYEAAMPLLEQWLASRTDPEEEPPRVAADHS